MSSWSAPKMVSPKAAVPLCPMDIPGTMGSPAPIKSRPGIVRWTIYRIEGKTCVRCGSRASIGRPVVVFSADMAQLFEPSSKEARTISPDDEIIVHWSASSRVATSRSFEKVAGLTASWKSRNTLSVMTLGSKPSTGSGTTPYDNSLRSISSSAPSSTPAIAMTLERRSSDDALRVSECVRTRTTSSGFQRSGSWPRSVNSGGSGISPKLQAST